MVPFHRTGGTPEADVNNSRPGPVGQDNNGHDAVNTYTALGFGTPGTRDSGEYLEPTAEVSPGLPHTSAVDHSNLVFCPFKCESPVNKYVYKFCTVDVDKMLLDSQLSGCHTPVTDIRVGAAVR